MTAVADLDVETPEVEAQNPESADTPEKGKPGRKQDRDFTKYRETHEELANYINANSGIDPLTPGQVKAVMILRGEFNNLPDQVARRAARKEELAAEKAKYEGMDPEQVKAEKAADRAEKQAEKLQARVEEARARAAAIRESGSATGADLMAQVEAEQSTPEAEAEKPKRRLGRSRG